MSVASSAGSRIPVNGVVLLDKPEGISSNFALTLAKRRLKAKKAGHTGTLDPFATGLLPLCFGEATKFAHDLLHADKTYETTVHLGITTSTGDTEGEVIQAQNVTPVTLDQIEDVLSRFVGEIDQIPPMYSALKRDGKPLYEYARSGIELERAPRSVTIHHLKILSYSWPYLSLSVACSKGTYIRTLGEDIGKALDCGAHLSSLRRVRVGELDIKEASTLSDIEHASNPLLEPILKPVDYLLSSFYPVFLSDELATRFMHGQRLSGVKENLDLPGITDKVRVYEQSSKILLGTAKIVNGSLIPQRLLGTNQLIAI
jgi:tRNA pseudouridine55 synthase